MAEMEVITDGDRGGRIEIMVPLQPKSPEEEEEEDSSSWNLQRRGRKRKGDLFVPRMLKEIYIDNNLHFKPQSVPPSSSGGGSHHWLRSNKTELIICSRPLPPPKDNAKLVEKKNENGVDNNKLAKRKKINNYRPKVVNDSLTPKTVTPSPRPFGKKLYRRKKGKTNGMKITSSSHTPSEHIDPEMTTFEIKNQSRPSCKKALMFDKNVHMTLEQTDNSNQQEQEAQVLHKRVESFMSSMKHIQGDRQFSRWKGSVLDSVVGAFLAQNVDDTLSSSAFMSLAAQYPFQSEEGRNSMKDVEKSRSRYLNGKSPLTRKRSVNMIKTYEDLDCKDKGGKVKKEENKVDWEKLRKSFTKAEEDSGHIDDASENAVDWYAVNSAEVNEVSQAIECRGMHNKLAVRIKKCLSRLMKEHGSLNLEWLQSLPPEKAKDFLLSIRGLGTKSVECIRLLALQHVAFPVDTHVARIAVRLGWVPVQPLPEGVQFHGLKKDPVVNSVHKYLSDRLRLEPQKLKELHIQMITFGKVFCTKKIPNCSACPMSGECKRFASERASTKSSATCTDKNPTEASLLELRCQLERDIEDLFLEFDPPIKKNRKAFVKNKQNHIQENHILFEKDELDGELTNIISNRVSIPVKEEKKIDKIRTKHFIYELPDSHSLLERFDRRVKNDHCPYLLVTWNKGETDSSQPSKGKKFPEQEEEECQTVLGTLLIPCQTATRGIFPLDGTYFQTNEVFADHESSMCPIEVPQESIEGLKISTLHCGNNVRVIYKGLPIEEILLCFEKGYVCLRGFNRGTRKATSMEKLLHSPYKSKRGVKVKKTVVKMMRGKKRTKKTVR